MNILNLQKYLTIGMLLLAMSPSIVQAVSLESFCRNKITQGLCLLSFLQYKCASYSLFSLDVRKKISCNNAALKLTKALDLAASPVEGEEKIQEEVAFKSALVSLISLEATTKLLNNIQNRINDSLMNALPFYFWDVMVHFSNNNASEAIANIAILFQDTTAHPRHIAYLKQTVKNEIGKNNILLLEELISFFSKESLSINTNIKVYPLEFQNILNNTFYHFYMMSYLSNELQKKGVSDEMSFFITFLFNTQYELKELPGWPFKDTKTHTAFTPWKVREIYGGYLGSLSGIRKTSQALPIEDFRESLERNPFQFLKDLFFLSFD